MIKGTIRINEDKGFYVEYSPKNVYSNYGSENITKTFYQELILNPFKDNSKYKDGDEIKFIKEIYIANEGSFYFAEIVEC